MHHSPLMHLVTSGHVLSCSSLPFSSRSTKFVHRQPQRLQCVGKSPAIAQQIYRRRCSGTVARAASQDTPSQEQGQISSELMQQMKESITSNLEADRVDVTDVYGDGRHVNIEVVSKLFEGQTSVKRQRLVYKAIWQELQSTVHAVDSMKTSTPQEAGLSS